MNAAAAPPLLALAGVVAERRFPGGSFRVGPADLRVERGERVVILGPNGAGKSTLLAAALGLVPPVAGRALLGGDDAADLPRAEAARRAVLLRQHVEPVFALGVLEYVLHGRWPWQMGLAFASDRDFAVARAALASLGCAALAERDLAGLSGGEIQRVRLAKALAQEAPLLVLDEPTAGLDLCGTRDFARLLREEPLARTGVLLVTHDLGLASAVASDALLLAGGAVVAAGPARSVLAPTPLQSAYGVPIEAVPRRRGHPLLVPLP